LVIGSEYDRDKLDFGAINVLSIPAQAFHLTATAVLAKGEIPILANHANPQLGDVLP